MPVSPQQGSPPPGLSEGWIQLPTDGSGKQLRAFPVAVYEQQADGTFAAATAYQQVIVLVDADGNLLGVRGQPLEVGSDRIEMLLTDLIDEVRALRAQLG